MPVRPLHANPFVMAAHEPMDNPTPAGQTGNFFPRQAWKEIAQIMLAHDRKAAAFELFFATNDKRAKELETLRCATYKFIGKWYFQVPKQDRAGNAYCPNVCIETEKYDGERSVRVSKLPNGD